MTTIDVQAATGRPTGTDPGTTPPPIEVRAAREADIPTLAQMLARAFGEDPLMSRLVPPGERQHERLVAGHEAIVRYGSDHLSDTYTTSDLAGAAIWMRPGDANPPLREWPGMLRGFTRMLGWRGFVTFMRVGAELSRRRHRLIPEPNYYLGVIGVEPERQGQGIGSAIMQPVLERCDRERIVASLQTGAERNLPFYERHGFRIVDETTVSNWMISAWIMRRDPE